MGVVVAVLAVMTLSGALTSCESNKGELDAVRNAINASRAQAGLPALRENVTLDIKADGWAQTLRNACRIWHSNLADGAPRSGASSARTWAWAARSPRSTPPT